MADDEVSQESPGSTGAGGIPAGADHSQDSDSEEDTDSTQDNPTPAIPQFPSPPPLDVMDVETTFGAPWGEKADDIMEIPYTPTENSLFSQSTLFPIEFSKDPVAGGEFISRATMNGILRSLSLQAKQYSQWVSGAPYDHVWCTTRGYPLGARLTILLDRVTHTLTTVKLLKENLAQVPELTYMERRTLCDTIHIESTQDDNRNSALDFANLFKYWKVLDGQPLLSLKMMGADGVPVPGYLDLGAYPGDNKQEPEYPLEDFPRIASLLKINSNITCSFFKKKGDSHFTTTDLRGLFARVFNNNKISPGVTPRDPGRSFDEIQDHSMAPIIGAFSMCGSTSVASSAYGDLTHRVIKSRVFMPVTDLPTATTDKPEWVHFRDLKKFNCCRVTNVPTNYMLSSDSYQRYGVDYSSFSESQQGVLSITGDTLLIDTSDHPNVSHEVRPKNFCYKLYIKV